jgi:3-isopropylmalate/(R)-2-methylmalate dehydratase small subunit
MRGRAHVHSRAGITSDEIVSGIDAGFPKRVSRGDILVAGEDFGCGPAREHAVWALRDAGIAAVVARSFSRVFFRNALNNGFLVLECPAAIERTTEGDLLEIDLQEGIVKNLTTGEAFKFAPFTPFAMEVLEAGGLLPYVLRQTSGASSA